MVAYAELEALVRITHLAPDDPVPVELEAFATGHLYLGLRAMVAWAVQQRGGEERAMRILGGPEPLGTDYTALCGACLSVEVLARLEGPVPAERLAAAVEELLPHVDQVATYGTVLSLGSTAYFVGSGLLALGRTEEAAAMLERAVEANREAGALHWERVAAERRATIAG